ncbi:type II toxin-antitoxin system PemK/MazF family toxin [Cephaloticoccus primus]|uniref:type II toxin-antitoxin system PemK/MazF family toxin n=1 Tax=Cephaloticoccus primus TaxID=1548207 RepID=UPI0031B6073C
MKRGEVWWVIGPKATVGTEIRKTRPALIISNEASIRRKGRATIIPLSSKTARLYPPETIVTVGGQLAKALVDQIGRQLKVYHTRRSAIPKRPGPRRRMPQGASRTLGSPQETPPAIP